jgi:hypothetical protein
MLDTRPSCQGDGVVNTIPFAYRFHPMTREMRARVQADDFGAINLMHGSYLQDWLLNPKATSWRVDPKAGGPSRAFGDIGSPLVRSCGMGDRRSHRPTRGHHFNHDQAAPSVDGRHIQRVESDAHWWTCRPRTPR